MLQSCSVSVSCSLCRSVFRRVAVAAFGARSFAELQCVIISFAYTFSGFKRRYTFFLWSDTGAEFVGYVNAFVVDEFERVSFYVDAVSVVIFKIKGFFFVEEVIEACALRCTDGFCEYVEIVFCSE